MNNESIIIKDLKLILNAKEVKVENRLLGGMSNYTYVVSVDDILYTYRIPGEGSEHFVNREFEKENIKIVEALGITNETIYLNTLDGKKIGKYIDGTILSTIDEEKYPYEDVASILKIIHNSSNLAVNDYEPFARLAYNESICKDIGFTHPSEYSILKEKFMVYQEYLESQEKVLTHGDSQPSNFIISEAGLKVVDFEFCGNNDPIYDIACFGNKAYGDGFKLLNIYYENPDQDKINRFHLWRAFQAFQWYNVAIYKDKIGLSEKLKIDFNFVANKYLELISFLLEKVK